MNIKGLMLAATLIAAPIGATAATLSVKNKKADTQMTEQTSNYQLSAQDYHTYIIPQAIKRVVNPDEALPFAHIINSFAAMTEEKRDSLINETTSGSLSTLRGYNNQMDSIKNETIENRNSIESRFNNKKYKTTNLDEVLNNAANDSEQIINLIDTMNEIDKKTNGRKAATFDIEMNYSDIIENVLGMDPQEFKNQYKNELNSLKDKEIPLVEPIPSPYMLTASERFVLDKINLLEEKLNVESIVNNLKIENNTVKRSDETLDEVYSAFSKLSDFNRNIKYETFVDFIYNESEIVVKNFLQELLKEIDGQSGINSVTADDKKPTIRKYTDGSKIIIEVTNPNDNSVKKYDSNGIEIK